MGHLTVDCILVGLFMIIGVSYVATWIVDVAIVFDIEIISSSEYWSELEIISD